MGEVSSRYVVTPRRRFHYPGYMTRASLMDTVSGAQVELGDRDFAEQVARSLEAGNDHPPARGIKKYRVTPYRRDKLFIGRAESAIEGGIFGLATDQELAAKVVDVLNHLDPGTLAPAKRIRIYWF
jgi:hypothetical protein